MFDLIIVGSGPTGMTSAIYAARRQMKTLVISRDIGGQMIWASEIHNYPGIKEIKNFELIQNMKNQVISSGVEIKIGQVNKITKQEDGTFLVNTGKEKFKTRTIILALGLVPKKLMLAKENELTGKGISYCANCDGPLYKGKSVAVAGGGNAALDAAEVLSKIAAKVYLIYRGNKFRGFEILINKVKAATNIEIFMDSEIKELVGIDYLEKIQIAKKGKAEIIELVVSGLFVEIGHEPDTGFIKDFVSRDIKNQIIIDYLGQTSQAGIFAAGDVTNSEYKQIIIGCGQGAVAALSAYKYLQTKN